MELRPKREIPSDRLLFLCSSRSIPKIHLGPVRNIVVFVSIGQASWGDLANQGPPHKNNIRIHMSKKSMTWMILKPLWPNGASLRSME